MRQRRVDSARNLAAAGEGLQPDAGSRTGQDWQKLRDPDPMTRGACYLFGVMSEIGEPFRALNRMKAL